MKLPPVLEDVSEFLKRQPVREDAELLPHQIKGNFAGGSFNTMDAAFSAFFGSPTYAGPTVNANVAMQQETVFTCTRIIAETFGTLPGDVYERNKDGSVSRVDHELAGILFDSPNADMDEVEYSESLGTNIALQGNTCSFINRRGNGDISSLYPVAWDAVIPQRNRETLERTFRILDRGKWDTYPADKIWHVKGFGNDGLIGFSPIGFQRQMIGMALATAEWQARFFSNGAMPSYFVTLPKWLEQPERDKARANLQEVFGGAVNAYKAQLLEGGMTATPASMPLEDAQFLQLAQKTKGDIFGMYRIPPHMGGDLERSTNNNIEQQALEFVTYCLMPYLVRFEKSAKRWLFKPADRRRFFVRWNVEGLLRADSAARGELYAKLLQNGVLTRNDVRITEKLNRVDVAGMDDYTVQTALVPIDMLRKVAENAAKKPVPATAGDAGSNALKGLGAGSINVVLPEMHNHISVDAPEVHQPAHEFHIHQLPPIPPDLEPLSAALKEFANVGDRIIAAMDTDVEVLRDAKGTAIGTKKVARKGTK